jgi:hypothetical protein
MPDATKTSSFKMGKVASAAKSVRADLNNCDNKKRAGEHTPGVSFSLY